MGEGLTVGIKVRNDVALLKIAGDLDVATVHVLEDVLGQLNNAGVRRYVLDVGRVDVVDSAGLRPITRLVAAQAVLSVSIAQPSPIVRRTIELTGLDRRVNLIG